MDFREDITSRFKRLEQTFGPPAWAWQFPAAAPLIGHHYQPGRGLLIYASAENLAWMNRNHSAHRAHSWRKRFFKPADVARSRYALQLCSPRSPHRTEFFSDVGIAPVSDGGLLTAGRFVAERMKMSVPTSPRNFLQTITATNWCKFAVRSPTNRDYVADMRRLVASLPYVVAELALLRPRIVLVPRRIWKHSVLAAVMRGACPQSVFLPLYQCNPRLENITLNTRTIKGDAARLKQSATRCTACTKKWVSKICYGPRPGAEVRSQGTPRTNFWRYLVHVDNELRRATIL